MSGSHFDFVVIGSGPAGQKAAIQGAKAGKRVAVIEKDRSAGGACVHHGTIPSKTLREATMALVGFRQRGGNIFEVHLPEHLMISSLMSRLKDVMVAHERYIEDQLCRNGVRLIHGRARFVSPSAMEILHVSGQTTQISSEFFFIATGSQPRTPPNVPVDHENLLDSDSILSLLYLPRSLTILGAGVIACEYASVFAALGVQVTMVDKNPRPLGFIDPELTGRFLASFQAGGGRYLGGRSLVRAHWDGLHAVAEFEEGETLASDKLLCCLGRVAALKGLNLEASGLCPNERGLLAADENGRTAAGRIYAIGDVAGPPSLATSAMEQGRRAACHALGILAGEALDVIPTGIYTIPEIACVGITEELAAAKYGRAVVGRARFHEIARGQIAGIQDGMLKMVTDPQGQQVLGVHIVGEGATELIHLGQLAILSKLGVDAFVENVFNFPTLAEAYRVAALDIAERRVGAPSAASLGTALKSVL